MSAMRGRQVLHWADLRVGITVTICIVLICAGIFYISGLGRFEKGVLVKTYMPAVSGLKSGAPVWLAGIEVGSVKEVNFIPPEGLVDNQQLIREMNLVQDRIAHLDRSKPFSKEILRGLEGQAQRLQSQLKGIEVVMKLRKKYRDFVRRDSKATVASMGLLGDRFVEVSIGSDPSPPPDVKGTLVIESGRGKDMHELMSEASLSVPDMGVLVNQLKEISLRANAGEGTLGKFINDPSLYDSALRSFGGLSFMMDKVKAGEGTIGRAVKDPRLYDDAVATVESARDVMKEVKAGKGTLGKLVSSSELHDNLAMTTKKIANGEGTIGKLVQDPSLFQDTKSAVGHIDTIAGRMERGEGTLGRLSTDDKLYEDLAKAINRIASIAEGIQKGEGTIGKLVKDKQFHETFNGFVTELYALIKDFRANPRKYLRIKLSFF